MKTIRWNAVGTKKPTLDQVILIAQKFSYKDTKDIVFNLGVRTSEGYKFVCEQPHEGATFFLFKQYFNAKNTRLWLYIPEEFSNTECFMKWIPFSKHTPGFDKFILLGFYDDEEAKMYFQVGRQTAYHGLKFFKSSSVISNDGSSRYESEVNSATHFMYLPPYKAHE